MSRRRNSERDLFDALSAIGGLLLFLFIFSPSLRQNLGTALSWLIGLVVLGLVGWGIYRIVRRYGGNQSETRSPRVYNLNTLTTTDVIASPPPAPRISLAPASAVTSEAEELWRKTKKTETPDLAEQLKKIDWFQFEKLVALVYTKLGYAVSRRGGANPDGGIDLIIEKDGQQTAVQCKQWKTWNVGVKAVREFLGALTHSRLHKGIFITLRGYTGEAKQLAQEHGIEILNEAHLLSMLKSTDVAYDPAALEILRDTRKFCPKCEREMVLRTAAKGPNPGEQFWGCSGYPRCRYVLRFEEAEAR